MRPAFGSQLRRYSPIKKPVQRGTRVLLATSRGDRYAQCERQLAPYPARSFCLPTGGEDFIPAVDPRALAAQHARERPLLARVSGA